MNITAGFGQHKPPSKALTESLCNAVENQEDFYLVFGDKKFRVKSDSVYRSRNGFDVNVVDVNVVEVGQSND